MAIFVQKRPAPKSFSGNAVYYELYSDTAAANSSNIFEVKIMLKRQDDDDYSEVVTLEYVPTSGLVKLDIKEILDGQLEYALPTFPNDETTIQEVTTQTGYFYIQFREITDQNADPSFDTTELNYPRFIIKGGLNYFKYRGNNFWNNYYGVYYPFLTWQLSGRLAARDERMYLAWLGNKQGNGDGDYYARVKVYFDFGETIRYIRTMVTLTDDNIYFIPAGVTQLDLQALEPDKILWKWEIQMMFSTDVFDDGSDYAGTVLSQAFVYEADNRYDYNKWYLHYRNSLGGIDSFSVRGVIETNLNYQSKEQSHVPVANYFDGHYIDSQRKVHNNKEQVIYKGDIGHLPKEEQDRTRDSQLLRETWREVNEKWIPVLMSTGNFKLRSSDDNLFSFPIEFQLAYDGDNYYTPDSVNLGDGTFENNVCDVLLQVLMHLATYLEDTDEFKIEWDFSQMSATGTSAETIQYWLDANPPAVHTLADGLLTTYVGRNTGLRTYYFRSICPDGSLGPIVSKTFDSTMDTGGGGPITPATGNSRITNNSSVSVAVVLKVNGVQVFASTVGSYGDYVEFDVSDTADCLVVLTITTYSPSSSTVTSNAVSYFSYVVSNEIKAYNVDIVNGIQITFN